MTNPEGTTGHRPRVLIVEEDLVLAQALVTECLKIGLEPKLCIGPKKTSSTCPGLTGDPCPRTHGIEATFIAISSGPQRVAAPSCTQGRVVVAGERPLVGAQTIDLLHPDVQMTYPYDPRAAAGVLFNLTIDERRRRTWDALRH